MKQLCVHDLALLDVLQVTASWWMPDALRVQSI